MSQVIVSDYIRRNADGGGKIDILSVGTEIKEAAEVNDFGYVRITVVATGKTGYFNNEYIGALPDVPPPPVGDGPLELTIAAHTVEVVGAGEYSVPETVYRKVV